MKELIHDMEMAERFLTGKMNSTERKTIAERQDTDPDFNQLIGDMDKMIEGIKNSGRNTSIEEKINMLRSTAGEESTPKGKSIVMQPSRQWNYAVAATIAFLIICLAGITYFLIDFNSDPKQLYAENFKAYPNVFEPIQRSGSAVKTKRTEAFSAYEAGNYQLAIELFNELLTEKEEPGILLLLGNANLMMDKTDDARNNFIKLINEFDEYDYQGKWYLALSYLKDGDVKTAQVILQEVSSSEYSYASKAKTLLEKID